MKAANERIPRSHERLGRWAPDAAPQNEFGVAHVGSRFVLWVGHLLLSLISLYPDGVEGPYRVTGNERIQ